MFQQLKGRVALITGGSNGIGRAISHALASEGAHVIFTYRTGKTAAESLTEELKKLGSYATAIQLDLSEQGAYQELYNQLKQTTDRVDILVNNVGYLTRSNFLETSPDDFDLVFKINIKEPFFLSQLITKDMIQNKIRGSIINISSLSSSKPISQVPHYQCSKAALDMLSKSMAFELAPHGIRVNTISPGLTMTKANRDQWQDNREAWDQRLENFNIPLQRAGEPGDFAALATFLASDQSSWVTGVNIPVDGGLGIT